MGFGRQVTSDSVLAQGSGNEMGGGSVMNDITATLEPMRNQIGENMSGEHNSRKRKRGELEHNSEAVLTKAKDTITVLPFAKKSPIWETYEAMDVFKRVPQSPHFSPVFEKKEDFREGFTLGMMATFCGLLDKSKNLKTDVPISQLTSLKDSFTELEKHGFNVTAPLSQIDKLVSLKVRQLKMLEELKGFDKKMMDESNKKHKAEQEFGEMERKTRLSKKRKEAAKEEKDAAYKKICEMESGARQVGIELEDVKSKFETTLSVPW